MTPSTHRWAKALAIGGILLALGGCASGQSATEATTSDGAATDARTQETTTPAADEAAQSQTFDGGSMSWEGKELKVELESNPTTGYTWDVMLTGSGLDFSNRDQDDAAEQGDDGEVGAPVIETFTFTGTGKGSQTITLTYKRTWETTDSDKVLTIEVVTGDDGTIERAEAVMVTGAEAAASGLDANLTGSGAGAVPTGDDDLALKDAGSGTDADVPNE